MFDLNQERKDINLDNPIFVCYINTTNFPRQRAVELVQQTKEHLDIYNNDISDWGLWQYPSASYHTDGLIIFLQLWDQVSISSTFYASLFSQYFCVKKITKPKCN
jgi:hypothetical protein